jgi:hypothetical protein
MTSVPKPLKFLRPHYDGLKATCEACADGDNRRLLADIVSLLAMTRTSEADVMPESLRFRLLGSAEEIGSWGHEARSAASLARANPRRSARKRGHTPRARPGSHAPPAPPRAVRAQPGGRNRARVCAPPGG